MFFVTYLIYCRYASDNIKFFIFLIKSRLVSEFVCAVSLLALVNKYEFGTGSFTIIIVTLIRLMRELFAKKKVI